MLLLRLPGNSKLSVVKFGGSQKLYLDFRLHKGEGAPLTSVFITGQLYLVQVSSPQRAAWGSALNVPFGSLASALPMQ